MNMLSITSPACRLIFGFKTMVLPLLVTKSIFTSQAFVIVMDFSLE